jgi:hypothetical protein
METIKAWAAGIIDGEGHVKVERYKQSRGIVRVDNTDMRILKKLEDYFGGKIYPNRRKNRPNSKMCWFWIIYGRQVVPFLEGISPYLIGKKDQAETVIGFYK